MLDWLFLPIDASRAHVVSQNIAWHGRTMVLAWGILVPCGILMARFYKIMPRQDWPRERDNRVWWISHRVLHYLAGILTVLGIWLSVSGIASIGASGTHAVLGWSVFLLAIGQFLGGWLRGSKGGPTDPAPDGSLHGDHYSMTPRRIAFEYLHKTGGYIALLIAMGAILSGLWRANAPVWMWIVIVVWWMLILAVSLRLQKAGLAVDTYQAIWGPDKQHPGNLRQPTPFGVSRREE